MKLLEDRIKRLKKATALDPILRSQETRTFIIKLNRFNQIFIDGERVDGKPIGEYGTFTEMVNQKRVFTVEGVSKRKKQGERYFLADSFYFFKSFKVVVDKGHFTIQADDKTNKDEALEKRFGKLVGLSKKSKIKLVNSLLPKLKEQMRKAM